MQQDDWDKNSCFLREGTQSVESSLFLGKELDLPSEKKKKAQITTVKFQALILILQVYPACCLALTLHCASEAAH